MKVKVLKLGYAAWEVTSEQGLTVDEAVCEIARDGTENDPECATSVHLQGGGSGSDGKIKDLMEQETGIEPAAITLATWRSTN